MMNDEIKKFIRLANVFITENNEEDVNEFLRYLFKNHSVLINGRNISKRKLANKAFEFVKRQKELNINENDWIIFDTYIYRDEENTNTKDSTNKRNFEDIDDIGPSAKRKKIRSLPSNNDFCLYSTETLQSKVENFIEFPDCLNKKMSVINSYINHQKECLKVLISGPAKCGKSTFIYRIAQEYNYQYIRVEKHYMESMDIASFDRAIERLGEGLDKVLLHFKFNLYPTKISDNFKLESDASSKFLMIFEATDAGSLRKCSDCYIEFPNVNKLDRQKYLEHFLFGYGFTNNDLNCEKMANLTPGYQIGEIKPLCRTLKIAYDTNQSIDIEDEFNNIITNGEIKTIIKTDKINWNDIGGHDEVKEKLKNIMNNIKDTKHFYKSNGVILHGPPGCGKTMLAKALSNEHEFSFVSVSCTDILSKYQGDSEKNVREAFNLARSSQPCILFIDEIDALCSQRSDENSGSRNTIVNTFLTEIDGIDSHKNMQLLVIGATNFIEKIDKAIIRSGRLGRLIEVNIPKSPEQRFSVLMAASKNGTNPKFGPCVLDEQDFSVENIFTQISSNDYTEDWNHSDLASLISESHQEMRNDPDSVNSNLVTMMHILSAHRAKNQEKKINISPKFNKYAKSIMTDELDQKFPINFQFNSHIMCQVEQCADRKNIYIGGRHLSGKSSLIVTIAKKYQYNLVTFEQNYFHNFQIDRFNQDITKFIKKNGPTIIHIDQRNTPKDVLTKLETFKSDLKVMLVFESLAERANIVIPDFSEEDLKRLFHNCARNLISEDQIDKYLGCIAHWTYAHLDALEYELSLSAVFHQDQIETLIYIVNNKF